MRSTAHELEMIDAENGLKLSREEAEVYDFFVWIAGSRNWAGACGYFVWIRNGLGLGSGVS